MARCYAELGRAFALLDDLPRAMELYELAIEYLDETSQAFFPRILTEYADLLERTGRLQGAPPTSTSAPRPSRSVGMYRPEARVA